MPSNQNIDVFQYTGNSGQNLSGTFTANVPINESTASQYQAGGYTEIITASGFQSVAYELNAVENASLLIGIGQSGSNPGGPSLLGFAPGYTTTAFGTPDASGRPFIPGASVSGIIPTGITIEGLVAGSGLGLNSGFTGNQLASIFGSGFATASPGISGAGLSGQAFVPAGFFTVQILGISGNPYMKVPFFNS